MARENKIQKKSSKSKPIKFVQPKIKPIQKVISGEQAMLGQMFGQGEKFFGSGEMLPISGVPEGEGSETWRTFGI